MLTQIRDLQQILLKKYNIKYRRYFFDKIDFGQMTGILGARGVGKTTFLLQYLRASNIPLSKKLYISADSVKIDSLFELALAFEKEEGKLLIIDEIHKYPNFELELKKIYDFLSLEVIFSGSSALKLDNAKADLSRRAVIYEIEGMSFREFIELKEGLILPSFSLEEILENHVDIAYELLDKFNLTLLFREYLKYGYYPFYFDKKSHYLIKLNETINTVIEIDIPSVFAMEYQNIRNLKKLIRLVCESHPYTPNIRELLSKMEMGEDYRSLYRYLDYLHKAKVLKLMRPPTRGDNIFTKPEKIYLNNTNLHYGYCNEAQIGTIREVFFMSMTFEHRVTTPTRGDFLIDEKYLFEVGGKNKGFKQIANIPNSFVVADDIEVGFGAKIPLWLFGFLY
jgi:predicted AAA+ superfamily ATPase